MGGRRSARLGRLLAPVLLLCASSTSAQSPQSAAAPRAPSATIIVLDGSRGMWTRIGGQTKVALVRTSLGEAFKTYEDRIAFGLVAFGHRQGKTCVEPELMAKPGELTSKTPGKLLFGAGFKPRLGRSIAAALVEAAKQTPPAGLDVVLITDGTDTVAGTGAVLPNIHNVYGRIPAGQFSAPGAYIDTVGVTVFY